MDRSRVAKNDDDREWSTAVPTESRNPDRMTDDGVDPTENSENENVVRVDAEGSIAGTAAASVGLEPLEAQSGGHNVGARRDVELTGFARASSTARVDESAVIAVQEDEIIEIPIYGEDVDVRKRVRIAEEVEVGKEAVQRTEQVAATVRHETVHVEGRSLDPGEGRRSGKSGENS